MPPKPESLNEFQPARMGLQPEVKLLRRLIQMVGRQADEECALSDLLRILDGLGKGSARLAVLLKAERQLGEGQDMAAALNDALGEVMQEMGLEGRK